MAGCGREPATKDFAQFCSRKMKIEKKREEEDKKYMAKWQSKRRELRVFVSVCHCEVRNFHGTETRSNLFAFICWEKSNKNNDTI